MLHGGVCILVKNGVEFGPLVLSFCAAESHFEAAGIVLAGYNICIITVYRSPNSSYDEFSRRLLMMLDRVKSNKRNLIVTGDFNVHFGTSENNALDLVNNFATFDMAQVVHFETRQNACIDNIFVDLDLSQCVSTPIDLVHLSDHRGIMLECCLDRIVGNNKCSVSFRPITDWGLFQFYNTIELVDWSFVSNSDLDINDKFDMFF